MSDENKTTAITTPTANVGRELQFGRYDREQVELLKRTVAKGATDDQFALFMTIAQRRKLDPFAKQIWCVLRKSGGASEMAVQTAIDGFRLIAQRTGEYDGQDAPKWCGDDGVWKDVWLSNKPPEAAMVLVYRKGVSRPSTGIAHLKSYAAYDDKAQLQSKWKQMPEHMLAKCAEALAFRKAFPEELSGVYTDDEMGHADVIDVPSVEKLVNVPPANAEPQIDSWVPFLTDLATAPGAADFAESIGKPVPTWTEAEIVEVWAKMIAHHTSRRALNEAVGPWAAIVERHAAASTRIARLKATVGEPYKARVLEFRAAEKKAEDEKKAAAAQEGAQP